MNAKFRMLVAVLSLAMLSACVSNRTYGDRAFEQGKFNEALDYYEQEIKDGSKDAELYHRAAKASIAVGSFSSAERYYSQALRYGGGLNVARELGDFYISTSNYASAVRVYQFLLREDPSQKEPIYNNLGTALMYAGRPFDAESYLMIAQQMQPKNPLPYLNLGLLYDRFLKQPWIAINFYDCFVDMGQGQKEQRQQAQQRIRELKKKWNHLYSEDVLNCGEAYSPQPDKPVADLAAALKVEGEGSKEPKAIEIGNPDSPVGKVEVERMVEDDGSTTVVVNNNTPPPEEKPSLSTARSAFAAKQYAQAEKHYSLVPVAKLDREDKRDLGIALLELQRPSEAASWLELSMNEREDPQTLERLIEAYRRSNQDERVKTTCARYRSKLEYKDATKNCPVPAPTIPANAP